MIAESKDRKAILETIFKTELYRRIETLLADRSSAIDSDYKQLKQQRQFILDSSHCEDQAHLSGKLQELQQQQASIAAALLAAASQLETAKQQRQQAQEVHNAFKEAAAAQTALQSLLEQRPAVAAVKNEAAQAEKAAFLEEIYNSTLRAHKHNEESKKTALHAAAATTSAQEGLQELHQQLQKQLQLLQLGDITGASDLTQALELLNRHILHLNSETAKLSGVTAELERLAGTLVDNEPCPVCGSPHHPKPATVSAAQKAELQAKMQSLAQKTQLLQHLQQQYQQAQIQLARCEAAQTAAHSALASADTEFLELRDRFKERLTASEFTTQNDFLAALRPESKRRELQQTITTYEQNLAAATDRLQRAQAAVDGKTAPDLDAVLAAEQHASQHYNGLTAQSAVAARERAELERQQQQLLQLEEKMTDLQEAYQTAAALAETARGNNTARLTFSAFVLQAILDDVLQAANLRLTSMSRGRYSLSRAGDVLDARRENGLNIEVTDSFTGVARPVKTLSGGEIFLASLSLALGLSDVVQAYAGGIHLDTILVDEGFGTLDPEALDMAIRTLTDLQKGGRLVGIISHVGELRERISARLEVIPGQRGSRAIFHV